MRNYCTALRANVCVHDDDRHMHAMLCACMHAHTCAHTHACTHTSTHRAHVAWPIHARHACTCQQWNAKRMHAHLSHTQRRHTWWCMHMHVMTHSHARTRKLHAYDTCSMHACASHAPHIASHTLFINFYMHACGIMHYFACIACVIMCLTCTHTHMHASHVHMCVHKFTCTHTTNVLVYTCIIYMCM